MRILLFHGEIDPLNHFTDHTKKFLDRAGCETLICTLPLARQKQKALADFFAKGVHAVIMYDGIGMCLKEIYNRLEIPVVNILVDHPMTFWHCMQEPPHKYIQFSPDEKHIEFSERYWNIEQSFFLPHMGTAPISRGGKRPIELLFAGSCWSFDTLREHIREMSEQNVLGNIFFDMIDYMLMDSHITIEEACHIVLKDRNAELPDKDFALILTRAKAVDEYVRMCYRDRVLGTILDCGMKVTVIGINWDKSDLSNYPDFHWIGPMPFANVFQYMRRSKVVLNVMPWFKAGSHERIFNSLLSGACPISDKSKWLEREFTDREDIVFYDLDEIEKLPGMIDELLKNEAMRDRIVGRGQEKTVRNFSVEKVMGEAIQKVVDLYYS